MAAAQTSSPTPTPSRPHRTLTLVIAVLVTAVIAGALGLGAGGLGGYLLGSPGGSASGEDRAAQNIAEGCAVLDRVGDELPVDAESLDLSEPLIFELTAAGSSFMAVGRVDESREALTEAGSDLVSGASTLNAERINETLEVLETECAAL